MNLLFELANARFKNMSRAALLGFNPICSSSFLFIGLFPVYLLYHLYQKKTKWQRNVDTFISVVFVSFELIRLKMCIYV